MTHPREPVSLSPVTYYVGTDNLTGWSLRGAPALPVIVTCQTGTTLTGLSHSEKRAAPVSLSNSTGFSLIGDLHPPVFRSSGRRRFPP